ncbi:MAG: tRNA (adenosine(37)-N6)-threonylcarbamoyltransferase complex dimerization subunit type 1 TsaB [Firmicutes bacterium]|nr:tRNA (adenosine(37)-N6)-threonylcarbamoyltransferase complex dimerization subunit type 1 TsaB [Bacillota bacterium]
MYVLGIDTSTLTGGVALLKQGELVGESVLNIRTTHSERLLPALEILLEQANITPQELDGIAVVTGPGSFTGIRIGVATAKGLAYALDHPLVGTTTLEAYGWQFKYFPGAVISLIDARREQVYWQAFEAGEGLNEPAHGPLSDVYTYCARLSRPCLFVGDGALAYAERIGEQVPTGIFPSPALSLLRPSAVADLGYTRLLQGNSSNAFALNPTYMRKTEAELKWQEKA